MILKFVTKKNNCFFMIPKFSIKKNNGFCLMILTFIIYYNGFLIISTSDLVASLDVATAAFEEPQHNRPRILRHRTSGDRQLQCTNGDGDTADFCC